MSDARPHAVYTLEGPDGVVRYVGVTSDSQARLKAHYSAQGASPFATWLREMKTAGAIVTMRIVERTGKCFLADAMVVERKWILHHHAKGSPIFNPKPKDPACRWVVVDQATPVETVEKRARRAKGAA